MSFRVQQLKICDTVYKKYGQRDNIQPTQELRNKSTRNNLQKLFPKKETFFKALHLSLFIPNVYLTAVKIIKLIYIKYIKYPGLLMTMYNAD